MGPGRTARTAAARAPELRAGTRPNPGEGSSENLLRGSRYYYNTHRAWPRKLSQRPGDTRARQYDVKRTR